MPQNQEGTPETAPGETINTALAQTELGLLVDDELENSSVMEVRAYDETQFKVENHWIGKAAGSLPRGVAYFFIASVASLFVLQGNVEGESKYHYVVTFLSFSIVAQIVDTVGRRNQGPRQ